MRSDIETSLMFGSCGVGQGPQFRCYQELKKQRGMALEAAIKTCLEKEWDLKGGEQGRYSIQVDWQACDGETEPGVPRALGSTREHPIPAYEANASSLSPTH